MDSSSATVPPPPYHEDDTQGADLLSSPPANTTSGIASDDSIITVQETDESSLERTAVSHQSTGPNWLFPPPPIPIIGGTTMRSPPPSYEEVNDPNGPPPSYDSLFGRLREVRKTSNGLVDFLKKLFVFLVGKIGLIILYVIGFVIPTCMVVIGSLYFGQCPAEAHIPIFLIVGGSCGLMKQLIFCLQKRSERVREQSIEARDSYLAESLQSLINSFLIVWFFTGCYWIYHIYKPNLEDFAQSDYCNPSLYTFSFWLVSSTYIFLAVVILLLCCISSAAVFVTRDR